MQKEEKCAPGGPAIQVYNGFYPYYCHPMPMAVQTIYYGNVYCQPQHLIVPVENTKKCCSNKCKDCQEAEEQNKVFITNPTFWNPRMPQKPIFEK